MSIELVPQLQTGAPSAGSTDWDKMIGLVSANEVPDLSFLTGWELTSGVPAIKQGVYIYHANATYRVNDNDEVIGGSTVAGINYIKATVAAGVMTLEWTDDKTGFSYNPAYAGVYDSSSDQLLNDILFIESSNYYRGRSFGMDFNSFYIAGGSVYYIGGLFTFGGAVLTGGGGIETDGGNIDVGGGSFNALRSGGFLVEGVSADSSWSISTTPLVIPKGVYFVTSDSVLRAEALISGSWRIIADDYIPMLISDGTNVRLRTTSGTVTIYYRKI